MENSPVTPSKTSDQQVIIDLLTEQNKTLHQLLEHHLKHDQEEMHRRVYSFLLHCIPYIIIIVLLYIAYTTLKSYLDTLNNEIASLHEKYNAIVTSLQSMVDKVTGIPGAIVEGLKGIKLF